MEIEDKQKLIDEIVKKAIDKRRKKQKRYITKIVVSHPEPNRRLRRSQNHKINHKHNVINEWKMSKYQNKKQSSLYPYQGMMLKQLHTDLLDAAEMEY